MPIPLLYLVSSIFTASLLFLAFRALFTTPDGRRRRTAPKTLPPHPIEAADYEVFLSFRGGDTQTGTTDHLYATLTDAGVAELEAADKEEVPIRGTGRLEKLVEVVITVGFIVPEK